MKIEIEIEIEMKIWVRRFSSNGAKRKLACGAEVVVAVVVVDRVDREPRRTKCDDEA